MAGIYVHIPFCKKKCHYCDFYFTTNNNNENKLIDAIKKELELRKNFLNKSKIHTMYFGGGTPSMIKPYLIGNIMKTVHDNFKLDKNAEITLESNPDDINKKNIKKWKRYGINRISLGIQSFDDKTLKFINRSHNSNKSLVALKMIDSCFHNYSVDLIYGIPNTTFNIWKDDISKILKFNPPHISAYNMTIEQNTVFSNWLEKGVIKLHDENILIKKFLYLIDILEKENYIHYETSNFCKKGFFSKHNIGYWKRKKYLGVGPSAHSFNGKIRNSNISNNSKYIDQIGKRIISESKELLTRKMTINEIIMTGIRTRWGINIDYLRSNLKYDILHKQFSTIKKLKKNKLIQMDNSKILATKKGKLFSNYIAEQLFI